MAAAPEYAITLEDVIAAAARIKGQAHRTPVVTSEFLARASGRALVAVKLEAFQKTGSFKARGALNAVLSLSDEAAAAGVVAHSSGNHAQAVAFAAAQRGVRACVVIPNDAPVSKIRAVRGYGASVLLCDPADRYTEADRLTAETGGTLIHSSNEPMVMAGQGTMGIELMEQMRDIAGAAGSDSPAVDAVIVPLGGGGMLSGIATAIKGLDPRVKVYGAEPLEADDAWRSVRAGSIQGHAAPPKTVADGLRTTLGSNTFPIVRDKTDGIVRVSEEDILRGMRVSWERLKVVAEPSAGTGIAALLSEEFAEMAPAAAAPRVAIILCGGNLDLGKPAPFLGVTRWECEGGGSDEQ